MRYKVLESMTPEERLRGLPPEERLRDLPPEQIQAALSVLKTEEHVLALPDELLRALSAEYIQTLPTQVQRTIRKRLAGPSKAKATRKRQPRASSKT